MKYTEHQDYFVRLIDLPTKIKGFVAEADGFANIYINSRFDRETNIATLRHELEHLERGDLYNDASADEAEFMRHG